MNIPESMLEDWGYTRHFELTRNILARHFGECELLLATDTLQYGDYCRYESEIFDAPAKLRRHKEVFPDVCQQAFDLGKRLASPEA